MLYLIVFKYIYSCFALAHAGNTSAAKPLLIIDNHVVRRQAGWLRYLSWHLRHRRMPARRWSRPGATAFIRSASPSTMRRVTTCRTYTVWWTMPSSTRCARCRSRFRIPTVGWRA